KGRVFSKEHREKLSKAATGRIAPTKGRPQLESVKLACSRANSGQGNGMAKLTESDVTKILARLEQRERYHPIAVSFGVTDDAVGQIARGERWRNVREAYFAAKLGVARCIDVPTTA
ncbi:MAG TPA: NUMOD3 domain-containing DNA-binding protein, partial [Candidatus Baltobacteraceae bacterium]|nr:NUMOD3 domain-containing DNA-binding protein [Candidatus Baltobacteraceae bacterium]